MNYKNQSKGKTLSLMFSILIMHLVNLSYSQVTKTINFEKLDSTINVEKLFIKYFIDNDSINYLLPGDNNIYKRINSKEAFLKFGQTQNVSVRLIYEKDITDGGFDYSDENKVIGKSFFLNRYTNSELTYFYKNLKFDHFAMITNLDNLLVGIIGFNSMEKEVEYEQLINNLKKDFPFSINEDDRKTSYVFKLKSYSLVLNKIKTSYYSQSIPVIQSMIDNKENILKKNNVNIEMVILFNVISEEQKRWLEINY